MLSKFVFHVCRTLFHEKPMHLLSGYPVFISNSEYTGRQQQDKKVTCQNFKIDGLSSNKPSRRFCLLPFSFHHIIETNLLV